MHQKSVIDLFYNEQEKWIHIVTLTSNFSLCAHIELNQ